MKKIKIENIIVFCLIVLFFILYMLFDKNPNLLFIFNLVCCFLICLKAKISIFSLKVILINYVLISIAYQYNVGTSYGILQMGLYNLNFSTANILVLIYDIIIYFFIVNSSFLQKEKEKILYNTSFSKTTSNICCILAIIFTFITMPSISFTFSSKVRFKALLPGNCWNHAAIIFLLLAMPKFKESKFVKFSYFFCISWFLLHGERVDVIGLLFCCLIMVSLKNLSKINSNNIKKYVKYMLAVLVIVFSMVYIGEIRAKNTNIDFGIILKKILVQNTAADVGYVYNVSIRYPNDFGYMYGKSYLNYIKELFPLSGEQKSTEFILANLYSTPGGSFILSEPYINFGFIGILIFESIELIVLFIIVNRKGHYTFYLYLFLIATTFRTSWYGLNYIETGIIYLLPIFYFICVILDRRFKYEDV